LHDQFKIEKSADKQNTLAVIASIGRDKVGLVVDEIIQEGEMVVKSLSKLLRSRKEFSGITILGNGKTVLILDVQNLI
jgi:two-component system chemotaxis sensor kinase CheA